MDRQKDGQAENNRSPKYYWKSSITICVLVYFDKMRISSNMVNIGFTLSAHMGLTIIFGQAQIFFGYK